MLLDFQGRRSGRAMSVPVNFNLVDDVPMAFTSAPWRHNFTGGIPVTVTHRGQEYQTTGTLVSMTPQAMGVAVRKSLDTGGSAQRMGIKTAGDHEPTAAELAALGPALVQHHLLRPHARGREQLKMKPPLTPFERQSPLSLDPPMRVVV